MRLDIENVDVDVSPEGLLITPNFVSYLQSQGYRIDAVKDLHTIPSESNKGKSYLVCRIETYEYPKDHPQLDLLNHGITIPVCSCWAYRQSSELDPPSGSCKHIRDAYREERATNDDAQIDLDSV